MKVAAVLVVCLLALSRLGAQEPAIVTLIGGEDSRGAELGDIRNVLVLPKHIVVLERARITTYSVTDSLGDATSNTMETIGLRKLCIVGGRLYGIDIGSAMLGEVQVIDIGSLAQRSLAVPGFSGLEMSIGDGGSSLSATLPAASCAPPQTHIPRSRSFRAHAAGEGGPQLE